MKHYHQPVKLGFAAILSLTLAFSAVAQEGKKFEKKDLPPAVLAAFEKAYPKAVIKGVGKEKEDGKICYEIESIDGKTKRDILYLTDGAVYEVEEGIAVSALPAAVSKAVSDKYPKAELKSAEKVMRGATVEYEVIVKAGKETSEIKLDATGKILKTEKQGADEEDDDDDEN